MFSISVASDMSGSFGSQRAECEVTEERICDLFGRVRPLRIEPQHDPVRGTEAELAQQIHVDIRAQRGVRRCLRVQVVGELLVALALARDRALDARGQRAPVVEQHVDRVLARQQDADVLDDREAEPLERIRARGRGGDDAFDQAIDRPLHQRREDVLLRRVAVMQTARQHAGRARDVAQRRPGVALLAKQPRRRLQGTVVVGAGFGRCLGHLTKSLPDPLHRAQAQFGQPTKEDILAALMERAIDRLIEGIVAATASSPDPLGRLRLAIVEHVRILLSREDSVYVLLYDWRSLSPGVERAITRQRKRYEQFADDLIAQAAAHTPLRPDVDVYLLRQFGFGAANWVAQWFDPKGPYTPEQIADAFFRYLTLGSLRPEGAC